MVICGGDYVMLVIVMGDGIVPSSRSENNFEKNCINIKAHV